MIGNDLHTLAFVLDPFVSKKLYSEVLRLIDGRPVMAVAQTALTKDLQFSGATAKEAGDISRSLAM